MLPTILLEGHIHVWERVSPRQFQAWLGPRRGKWGEMKHIERTQTSVARPQLNPKMSNAVWWKGRGRKFLSSWTNPEVFLNYCNAKLSSKPDGALLSEIHSSGTQLAVMFSHNKNLRDIDMIMVSCEVHVYWPRGEQNKVQYLSEYSVEAKNGVPKKSLIAGVWFCVLCFLRERFYWGFSEVIIGLFDNSVD